MATAAGSSAATLASHAATAAALKQELARMQHAASAAARRLRDGPPPPSPHQAAASLHAADVYRAQHEDPYERDVRLRKDKLDDDAVQIVALRRATAERDASFLRRGGAG